jgi:Tetratricopeptide repeat
MSERDAGRKTGAAYSRVLVLVVVAAMSLSACGSQAAAPAKAAGSPTQAAVTKAAACARVVSIKSEVSDIQAMVFQTMSVGSPSRVWGPIVMDLDRQTVQLNKEATAKKLVCAGPAARRTAAPSGRVTTASGGATTASGGATTASGGATKAPGGTAKTAGGAKAPKIDRAKVAALTAEVAAHPEAIVTMQTLGDMYFFADDFKKASAWYQRVLDVEPKNRVLLLSLGVAQSYLGNMTEAEKNWRVAEWLYPEDVEVHYNLGDLYQNANPPDTAKMTAQWKKVIQISPDTDLAKLVAPQLR